jgi:cytochrome c-type biogenesis protein CcmH
MMRTLVVLVPAAWLLIAVTSAGIAAPTLDDQVYAIARDLMCPVCAGQTVAESNSQLAQQMRDIIRQRLQQGQSREEIIAYFRTQFGDGVLAAPPARGGGLILWVAPILAVLAGALLLQRFVRRNMAAPRRAPPPPTAAEAEEIQRDLRSLD